MAEPNELELIAGLGYVLAVLVGELVNQNALDREKAIRTFEAFASKPATDGASTAKAFFSGQIAQMLKTDPGRPPPAPIVPLR